MFLQVNKLEKMEKLDYSKKPDFLGRTDETDWKGWGG